jgi:hypothetical protein
MIDEAVPDLGRAGEPFTGGMAHKIAFWDVP